MTGSLREDCFTFMIISRLIIFKMRSFQIKFVGKIKTHFMFTRDFSKSSLLQKNRGKYDRPRQAIDDIIIRRMRVVCWITKTRFQTHS
jgi:hypothetical protein